MKYNNMENEKNIFEIICKDFTFIRVLDKAQTCL